MALSVLHENYSCHGEAENDQYHGKIFQDLVEEEEKDKPLKKMEKSGPSCCLLKRFFQVPGQFSDKSYKNTSKIAFVK